MRKHITAMLSASLLFTSASALADLAEDMRTLKDNFATVKKSRDAGEIERALGAMRKAAQDARTRKPEKLAGKTADSAQMKGYHAELDTLIGQIDVAMNHANSGDVAGAQAAAENFTATMKEGHKNYR